MAKNIIPQGTTAAIAARVNKYEESQKQRIIEVCQSNMKYADVLGFIEGEIKQSKKMASFKYTLLCWKPDGVYQLNRAINEVFGSAVSKEDKSPSGNSNIDTVDVILADGSRTKVPLVKSLWKNLVRILKSILTMTTTVIYYWLKVSANSSTNLLLMILLKELKNCSQLNLSIRTRHLKLPI